MSLSIANHPAINQSNFVNDTSQGIRFFGQDTQFSWNDPFDALCLAQTFNLTLDLDTYYAYVFDSKLEPADCKEATRSRRFFDRSQSNGYRQQANDFPFLLESDKYFVWCKLSFDAQSAALGLLCLQ
jgi:hypothetical protein